MLQISFIVAALVAAASSNPQYAPVDDHQDVVAPAGYPACDAKSDCVQLNICVNGVIDTSGAGSLDLRGKPQTIAEKLGYVICGLSGTSVQVCCLIPSDVYDDGQIVSGGGAGGYEGQAGIGGAGHVSGGGHVTGGDGFVSGGGHAAGGGDGFVSGGGHAAGGGDGFVSGGGHGSGLVDGHGSGLASGHGSGVAGGLAAIHDALSGGGLGGSGGHGGLGGSGGHGGLGGSGGHGGLGGSGGHGGLGGSGGHGGLGGSGGHGGLGGSGGLGGVGGSGGLGGGGGGVGGGYVDTTVQSSQCGVYEECVLRDYCLKGIINTGGVGSIDLRGKYKYNTCVDPEYPENKAVCCRFDDAPPVVDVCPGYEVCTDYQFCSPDGFVSASIFFPRYTSGTECYLSPKTSALTGVCCKPTCPSNSVCISEDFCFGDIQSSSGDFSPYSPGGSWAKCDLIGQDGGGVCCQNPLPTEPTATQCGISQYAQTNSIKTRYKTPTITKLEADFGEFPWQAIVFFSNYTFRCGASIISDKHLITAAHCVRDHYPEDFRIRVGEWQVNTFTEPYPYHDYEVAKITYHPLYKRGPEHNNIVILELASPMTLAYNVNTICLPQDSYSFAPGTRCFVSGWGKDSFVGTYQHILKKVDVPLVEHSYCQTLLRKTRLGKYFRLHKSFLCAGGEKGKDACTGDGGGPLVCLDNNNQYVLVGVTSWGIGCGVQDVPGVYADVSQFVPWIFETIDGVSGTQYGK